MKGARNSEAIMRRARTRNEAGISDSRITYTPLYCPEVPGSTSAMRFQLGNGDWLY
jgi:hypothetical protein